MNIISKAPGRNIVARCYALPPVYPDATVPAAYVEIYWRPRNADEPAPAWNFGGRIAPQGAIEIEYNPALDKNVEVSPMPYSASGVSAFSSIDDAFVTIGQTLTHQRESDSPTIGLRAGTTVDIAQIGIASFTRFARYRRVRIAANADMSGLLDELLYDSNDYASHELPRFFELSRTANALRGENGTPLLSESGDVLLAEDNSAALPQTIYVTVAHSGGVMWTPESNILQITFASGDGSTPGSLGDFDPTPRDSHDLGTL